MKVRLFSILSLITILLGACSVCQSAKVDLEPMFNQLILDDHGEANTVIKIVKVSHDDNQVLDETSRDPYTIDGYGIMGIS